MEGDRRMIELPIWKPIQSNIVQEVYIPLAIIMTALLLIVVLTCLVSYIRFKELTKLGSQGINRLDKYKRWSRKQVKTQVEKSSEDDTQELEKLVKKLIKDELINMMK